MFLEMLVLKPSDHIKTTSATILDVEKDTVDSRYLEIEGTL